MIGVPTAQPRLYVPAEVAQRLRCSERWVKEQARRRRIPFCWTGGSYRFTDEHVATIVRLFEVQLYELDNGQFERCPGLPGSGGQTHDGPHP
jgi:excisionase family DNA binding protein